MLTYPPTIGVREQILEFLKPVDWYSPYGGTTFFISDLDLVECRKQINKTFPNMFFCLCQTNARNVDGIADKKLWEFLRDRDIFY